MSSTSLSWAGTNELPVRIVSLVPAREPPGLAPAAGAAGWTLVPGVAAGAAALGASVGGAGVGGAAAAHAASSGANAPANDQRTTARRVNVILALSSDYSA